MVSGHDRNGFQERSNKDVNFNDSVGGVSIERSSLILVKEFREYGNDDGNLFIKLFITIIEPERQSLRVVTYT